RGKRGREGLHVSRNAGPDALRSFAALSQKSAVARNQECLVSNHYTFLLQKSLKEEECWPGARACPGALAIRFDPDAAFVHEINLTLNNLFAILRVLHGLAIEIEILGINWL